VSQLNIKQKLQGRYPKKGRKRGYLNNSETKKILQKDSRFFENKVEIKRIRNGEHKTIETLINEEALLLAKYLRDECRDWAPRISIIK
jgi:hypothetical protein